MDSAIHNETANMSFLDWYVESVDLGRLKNVIPAAGGATGKPAGG